MRNLFLFTLFLWIGSIACETCECQKYCPFSEPLQIYPDSKGEIDVALVVSEVNICIGEFKNVKAAVYNNTYGGFVINIAPGGVLKLLLVNDMEINITNFHFHGMTVSSSSGQDDIFISVPAKSQYQYKVYVPESHRRGLYWFHSHAMNNESEYQVFNGLSGGINVMGILDIFSPPIQQVAQHYFLMKESPISFDNKTIGRAIIEEKSEAPWSVDTVNGQINPILKISPNELQFWRFAAIAADRYYNITFHGIPFYVVAVDGSYQDIFFETTTLFISPASRFEVFVYGPPVGTYNIVAEYVSTGPVGDNYFYKKIATVVSSGPQVEKIPIPLSPGSKVDIGPDLRKNEIVANRTIIFSEDSKTNLFYINGRLFKDGRIDTTVSFGTTERWTIINNSSEMHVFHIHQMEFQVVAINDVPLEFAGYRDSINVDYIDEVVKGPGSVTILLHFIGDWMDKGSKFVYHCHIMEHEDKGMMATIEVI